MKKIKNRWKLFVEAFYDEVVKMTLLTIRDELEGLDNPSWYQITAIALRKVDWNITASKDIT